VGDGHAAFRVGEHDRAARAGPETHPASRYEGQHSRLG
jgi:hypothetical protein